MASVWCAEYHCFLAVLFWVLITVMAERDAMGADEYHPISRKGSNLTEAGGVGYTVVDALDTMLIMGLDAEYQRARNWVAEKMTFERDANFNTFEVASRFFFARVFHAFV